METPLSNLSSTLEPTEDKVMEPMNVIVQPIPTMRNHKPKLPWEKLSKFVQWKLFKAYMHENDITDGALFKRMKSMISEKRTNPFVFFDAELQKIVNIDFKHEVFIRERSKKGKLKVQLAQSKQEQDTKALEAAINGVSIYDDNMEVIEEEHMQIDDF
jgi:hypothetical protein